MNKAQRQPESVWEYPRPPRVESDDRRVLVVHQGVILAESNRSVRVLETSHPPVFYVPAGDVRLDLMVPNPHRTFCEFKGSAVYWDVAGDSPVEELAWSYPDPSPGFEEIRDRIAFYPSKVECYLDGERVLPQGGGYYGGWVTTGITGPFKGGPGTAGW